MGGKALGERNTKDCFVVLKRLDEKLLNRYLRCDSFHERTMDRHSKETISRKKCNSPERSVRKLKKSRIKPLCYTDDGDDSACSNPVKCISGNDSRIFDSGALENSNPELVTESGRDGTCCGADLDFGDADSGMEVMKELPRNSEGNVSCDRINPVSDDRLKDVMEEYQESEDEAREEGEDDRSTVIFDKVADLEEVREGKKISKKLKKKKITNRKKQRLIKFKRKSMTGRNLGKIRTNKSKPMEGPTVQEKSLNNSSECIVEDCLKEVCGSVRRLHDMYTIILQLQKEMPKDTELAIHFKRVIHSQQENFHREIRKTRKVIIKSFEKMMKVYKILNKVASEVGKRIYLTTDEVIYVLSLCILSEGPYDVDKTEQNTKPSANNACKVKITRKESPVKPTRTKTAAQEVVSAEMPNLPPPPGLPSTAPPLHPNSAPVMVERNTAGPPPGNNQQVQCTKPKPHSWPRQNFENDSRVRETAETNSFGQMNPNPPVIRQPIPITQALNKSQYCSVPDPNQNWLFTPRLRPPLGYTPCAAVGHYQPNGNVFPRPGGVSDLRFLRPSRSQFSCTLEQPTANSVSNAVGCPALNTPRYSAIPNSILEINQSHAINKASHTRGAFPTLEPFRYGVGNIYLHTSTSRTEPGLVPAGYSQPSGDEFIRQRLPDSEENCGIDTNSTAPEGSEIQVLDPTIPQKLTMRNCRLQAGPVLGSDVGAPKERGRSDNLDQEHSKTRVYICAQNNCKNPGIRICKFCESVIYCSETCQLKHWELKHKIECCQLKELRG